MFFAQLRRCRSDAERQVLLARMPIVAGAFAIYEAGGLVRAALEARVLAGETVEAIATKAALPANVVACYEDLFYAVRVHLGSRDYVRTYLLPPPRDAQATDYETLWKWFGFLAGPAVLDEIMGTVSPTSQPQNSAQVQAFLTDAARAGVRRQLAQAARTLTPNDPQAAAALLRMFGATPESPENAADAERYAHQMVAAMLDEIPWIVGRHEREQGQPAVAAFEAGAAELRADEAMIVAAKQPLPQGLADAMRVKMPPPSSKRPAAVPDPSPASPSAATPPQRKPPGRPYKG